MSDLAHKNELILKHEQSFADAVAVSVLDKPKVSMWMILLPILLLHFVYRQQRFSAGRKKFAEEFMVTRSRALDAARQAVATGKPPNTDAIVRKAKLPETVLKSYADWVKELVIHYMDLLRSTGDSFAELVRSAYENKTNYLLTLNRLKSTEKIMYTDLKPHLADTTAGATEIIAAIEYHSQRIRRERAEDIFPI